MKELLQTELSSINQKLGAIESKFMEISKAVDFLSAKYDQFVTQIQTSNEKILNLTLTSQNLKKEATDTQKLSQQAIKDCEELSQYLRRDCLEITGVQPNDDCSCEEIISSIGKLLDLEIDGDDISIAHILPAYHKDKYPPKIIVKFTRRTTRNTLLLQPKEIGGKKGEGRTYQTWISIVITTSTLQNLLPQPGRNYLEELIS